jgi:hypothetical protein
VEGLTHPARRHNKHLSGVAMPHARDGRMPETSQSLRQKASDFAHAAKSARDEVAFRELATLATLHESRAAELDVASSTETEESLRRKAADVLRRAEEVKLDVWRTALRAIAAIYISAAEERRSSGRGRRIVEEQ